MTFSGIMVDFYYSNTKIIFLVRDPKIHHLSIKIEIYDFT